MIFMEAKYWIFFLLQPGSPYGNTVVSLNQEYAYPYYPNLYSNFSPVAASEYLSYPVQTYNPRPYTPSVTVNAFTDPTGIYRQAQTSPQKFKENKESKEGAIKGPVITTIPAGTIKRETDSMQVEKNQQTNNVQQAVESGATPVKMMFDNEKNTVWRVERELSDL